MITYATSDCTSAARITRSLLGYGLLAGPMYVGVSLAQALTRRGFDLGKHSWSLLANGDLGWIQITNFVLASLATVAAGVGLRRVLSQRLASTLIAAAGGPWRSSCQAEARRGSQAGVRARRSDDPGTPVNGRCSRRGLRRCGEHMRGAKACRYEAGGPAAVRVRAPAVAGWSGRRARCRAACAGPARRLGLRCG